LAYRPRYAQQALSDTQWARVTGSGVLPSTTNVVMAMCALPENQEDAIVLNKASVERGLFDCDVEKTMVDVIDGLVERQGVPTERRVRSYDYTLLGPDGLIEEGAWVKRGTVLLGKVSLSPTEEDTSTLVYNSNEPGRVAGVIVAMGRVSTDRVVSIRIRARCLPQIGDKFASRHGQKGVVAAIVAPEDLPFSMSGMVPDVFVNPAALPTRMTIGHMFEALFGKLTSLAPEHSAFSFSGSTTAPLLGTCDATPFSTTRDVAEVERQLVARGFAPTGRERFYNGCTGMMIEAPIYVGPMAYQRLRHRSVAKINPQAKTAVVYFSRQPVGGAAAGGGQRFGHMEGWAAQSHGAAHFMRDRNLINSDGVVSAYCNECGERAVCSTAAKLVCSDPTCSSESFESRLMPHMIKVVCAELAVGNLSLAPLSLADVDVAS
jgi:DNA-directed RNA polymerase II subunit RPB2